MEAAGFLISANLFATPPAYTNHAGHVISGVVTSLSHKEVVLSNATEIAKVPLSIFPESEQRRIATDYATATGDIKALHLPPDVKRALESTEKAIRRCKNRAAKGLCTKEEARNFIEQSLAARKAYLDKLVETDRITEAERKLLN